MATALDLLMSTKEDVNLLSEESDICTIDAKTRAIFVPSTIVVGGVQSDKNAERIKFSCPKIVGDNLDLSKFSVRINFENVSSVDFNVSIKDQYICDDVAVDGENVTFSWLIGRNAARYMGTVRFIVCAVKTDSDSNISVEWNTAIAEVPVLEGIEIDQPQIGQEEKDVINQLLELTKNTSAEAVQNVNSAKEQAIKDIQSVSQPDTTLTIEGGLAEAKATGEAIDSLKEDIGGLENLKYRELYYNLFYDFFAIVTNKSGSMTEYGNAQHIFVKNVYSNGVKLESGNYLVALKLTNISLKRRVNVDASFALCIIDGWSKKYLGDIQYYNGEKELFVYSIINFTNDNNIKVSPALILNGGFESNSEYSFDVDTIAIIKNNTNGLPESIFHYGNNKIYPVFDMYGNLSNFKNAYILNKKLVANDTSGTSNVSAQYTAAKMGNTVNKIMLKGIFDTNTIIAIATEPNGMTNVTDVTKRSIHVTFSAGGCSVGYFDNKALTNIKNISWDGDYIGKEVTIGFEISGNVITVYLPNGNTLTVTNEKLISCGGKYALWEHYIGGLNKRIFHSAQFTKIYAEDADGNVLCDDFNRENGSIGISPQGYVYAQFTNENQTGWSF